MALDDPKWRQVYSNCHDAFSIARSLWQGVGPSVTPEALQSTFATVLIHSTHVKPSPEAERSVPAPNAGRSALSTEFDL